MPRKYPVILRIPLMALLAGAPIWESEDIDHETEQLPQAGGGAGGGWSLLCVSLALTARPLCGHRLGG